jgi:hypothetical protein
MLADRVLELEGLLADVSRRLVLLEAAESRRQATLALLPEDPVAWIPEPVTGQANITDNPALVTPYPGREVQPCDWITINGVRTLIGQFCADIQAEYASRDAKIEELEGRLRMAELQAENERALR